MSKSVTAAGMHEHVLSLDDGSVLPETVDEILDRRVDVKDFLYSRTLFNVIARTSTMAKQTLMIDNSAIKERYRKPKLQRIGWRPRIDSAAAVLTKYLSSQYSAMRILIISKELGIEAIGRSMRKEENIITLVNEGKQVQWVQILRIWKHNNNHADVEFSQKFIIF